MTWRRFNVRFPDMGRDQAWIYPAVAIAATYAAATFIIKAATGYPGMPNGFASLSAALLIVAVTAFCRFLRYLFRMWHSGEGRPTARMVVDFFPALRSFAPIIAGVAILGVFLFSISLSKSMIPAVVPFWADSMFAAMDRAIWLDPASIARRLTAWLPALGIFYGLWHAAHIGGIVWVLHWRRETKARHILSFMLTWSIGMLFAYLFSSMGPIFTGIYDPSVAPPSVKNAAGFLLANYRGDEGMIGGGISAFPSMHVAIAAWLAIVLRNRGWPKTGIAYLIGVFACSIILGWHYAIDGIAGAAIALLADRLARAWLSRATAEVQLVPQQAGIGA